jgi:uncharacterized protein (DUF305 family)
MYGKLILLAALISVAATFLQVQKHTAQSATSTVPLPPAPTAEFTASTDKTFDQLMGDAMSVMHKDMHNAPHTGDPDRDFVALMIPHQQGAIDMAKAILLYGKDPQLRQLAQEIITDRQSEIQLMQLWLKQQGTNSENAAQRSAVDASKR